MVNEKNIEWINGISPYFTMIININTNFQKINNKSVYEKQELLFQIVTDITRIIPIISRSTEKCCEVNLKKYSFCLYKSKDKPELNISKRSGLLTLKKYKSLYKKMEKILTDNYDGFNNITIIRNKYIHEPHNIKWTVSTENNKSFYLSFSYKSKKIIINSYLLSEIIYKINLLFKDIQDEFINEINGSSTIIKQHPYIKKISDINFDEYNDYLGVYRNDKITKKNLCK